MKCDDCVHLVLGSKKVWPVCRRGVWVEWPADWERPECNSDCKEYKSKYDTKEHPLYIG